MGGPGEHCDRPHTSHPVHAMSTDDLSDKWKNYPALERGQMSSDHYDQRVFIEFTSHLTRGFMTFWTFSVYYTIARRKGAISVAFVRPSVHLFVRRAYSE